ncbi:MAG TPA: PLP-dependent aminotransferase family protein [Steroidobacteraceae bacterium]|jgi:DNA-binding transcriptional MocR family regulator|nr:PLP-dependent aminotransferase family protein [Steroidobacteraceae bacterium]
MSAQPAAVFTRAAGISAQVRGRILAGHLGPGDRLPSVRALARSHGVSPFTAARVYDLLVAEGLIEARRGSGYYVARDAETFGAAGLSGPEPIVDSIWALRRDYEGHSLQVDAGCGWLPPEWLFGEGVRAALTQVARRPAVYAGRYGCAYGLRALRHHLARQLALRGVECADDQIVLTQGASQALELVIGTLARPGDSVLVEDPCYPYVLAMVRACGAHPVGVPRRDDGPDANALDSLARQTGARLFITNTTYQNPTGTTTSIQVAHAVLHVAERHGLTICEDDIFAELPADRVTPLASLDRLERVIYIGSFSKTIAPALRSGYLAASAELAERLAMQKNMMSLSSSELIEHVVLAILTSGRYRTHLERLRRQLTEARARLTRRFRESGIEVAPRSGGMFVWAQLPAADATATRQRARLQGILLAPGELFRPDGRPTGHWRFNVAYADDERLYAFLRSLIR